MSEEQSPHAAADTLTVVEDIKLVYKLVHCVAGLGDGAQVSHETHVVALLGKGERQAEANGSIGPSG